VDEVKPPPYSMEILCKLGQLQSDLEREAFLWFACELLQYVSGKRAWGRGQSTEVLAEMIGEGPTVTMRDSMDTYDSGHLSIDLNR
jgi:hypothetical protein